MAEPIIPEPTTVIILIKTPYSLSKDFMFCTANYYNIIGKRRQALSLFPFQAAFRAIFSAVTRAAAAGA
jgi:hypothetical protein